MEEFKEMLNQSEDKLSVLGDVNKVIQYDMTMTELINVIQEVLSDEEKERIFEFTHFQNLKYYNREQIIKTVKDDQIKIRMIKNEKIISEIPEYSIQGIMNGFGNEGIKIVLNDSELLNQYDNYKYLRIKLFKKLDEKSKLELLQNKEFVETQLEIKTNGVSEIVSSLKNDKDKVALMRVYEFGAREIVNIAETLTDDKKIEFVLNNEFELKKYQIKDVVKSLSVDKLIDFIKNETEFFEQYGLKPYEVTRGMEKEAQLELVAKLEDMKLDLNDKRKILATLKSETKKELDVSEFSKEYKSAVEININEDYTDFNNCGKIIIDLNGDLESYRGLDELIYVQAMDVVGEDKSKLFQLCEICPDIRITDKLNLSASTTKEYKEAEEWIDSVVQQIKPEWSQIQKVAFIDNAIGKKVSYSPDFDTELSSDEDARALWKIISSGYGVCNGIAQVEKYIFDRIGIESEEISGVHHAFLKLKNIELPTATGQTVKGDTVLDPTWNLATQRYGARPDNFCVSYEEIRKHDIDAAGKDQECHKNDQELASATIGLDEQSLREVYSSIGLADKDGQFPIAKLLAKSKEIDSLGMSTEESIKKQFELIGEYYPDFAECPNSTMRILQGISLNQVNQEFNRCVVNRVYDRKDEDKKPVMYVYADIPETGKKFYYADKSTGEFLELSQQEFEERFECYEKDMERQSNHRPWEDIEQQIEDLTRASGKVIAAKEGGER